MRYLYLSAISFLLLFSCSKKESICTAAAPQPIFIRLVNPTGIDLLKPTNTGAYQSSEISLTYVDNGVGKNLQARINPIPNTDTFLLSSYTDGIARNEKDGRIFYLKLSAADTDTFFVRYNKVEEENGCTSYTLAEFKYNNISYSSRMFVSNFPSIFEIIKR